MRLTSLAAAEPVDLAGAEVVLGGRTVLVDGDLFFDCGQDRFVLTGAERRRLLGFGHVLLDTLRCEAIPPG